eukprot:Awhi_evm1s6044
MCYFKYLFDTKACLERAELEKKQGQSDEGVLIAPTVYEETLQSYNAAYQEVFDHVQATLKKNARQHVSLGPIFSLILGKKRHGVLLNSA